MFEGDFLGAAVAVGGGCDAGAAPEAEDPGQGVAHDAFASMDASRYFAHRIQAGHSGGAIGVDHRAAVLVVQGRMNQQGFDTRVDARDAGASHTPTRWSSMRMPRPSLHSRRIAAHTTSRGWSSSMKRRPRPFTSRAPAARTPSVTSLPARWDGGSKPVGWYWKESSSRNRAPIRYARTSPSPVAPQ